MNIIFSLLRRVNGINCFLLPFAISSPSSEVVAALAVATVVGAVAARDVLSSVASVAAVADVMVVIMNVYGRALESDKL